MKCNFFECYQFATKVFMSFGDVVISGFFHFVSPVRIPEEYMDLVVYLKLRKYVM